MTELRWTRNSTFRDSARDFRAVGPGTYEVPDEAVEGYLDHEAWEPAEGINTEVFFGRSDAAIVRDLESGEYDEHLDEIRAGEPEDVNLVQTTLAAREAAEELPDDVDPNEAVEQLWFGPGLDESRVPSRPHIKTVYRRIRGDGAVSKKRIDSDLAQYLRALPGIIENGSQWIFDPAAAEAPVVPENPEHLSDEGLDDALDKAGIPDSTDRSGRNRVLVRAMYERLRDEGPATRDELLESFSPAHIRHPSQAEYTDPEEWWCRVARSVLAKLPGIAAPVMPARCWVYTGIGGEDR